MQMNENKHILQLRNVCKRYSKSEKQVLQNISFCVNAGEIVGILGSNGSGKTTTIKSILRLLNIDSGEILFDGKKIEKIKQKVFYSDIAAVLEGNRNLYWFMTAMENILYFGRMKGLKDADIKKQGLEYLGLFGLADEKDTQAADMSRGMQQKLSLTVSLLGSPKLILLDEPTLGLDIVAKNELMAVLKRLAKEKKVAVVITSHQTDVIDNLVERIILIDNHKIAFEGSCIDFKQKYSAKAYRIKILGQPDSYLTEKFKITKENNVFEISIEDKKQDDIFSIVQDIANRGFEVLSFSKDSASLEDIMLKFYNKGE